MLDVVAAVIRDGDRVLLCRRPETKARGLLWEFPGGKVEAGESPEAALLRECREELGVTLAVGAHLTDVVHRYPDLEIRLMVYEAAVAAGTPQLLEHCELRWTSPEELGSFPLCPADVEVAAILMKNGARQGGGAVPERSGEATA